MKIKLKRSVLTAEILLYPFSKLIFLGYANVCIHIKACLCHRNENKENVNAQNTSVELQMPEYKPTFIKSVMRAYPNDSF